MVADSPSSGLQETLEQNVAYGTVDSEKHPDATVPHASQMHEKPKTGKCNNGHDNATTKGWGHSAAFRALAPFLCTLFNALQVNDRSHFVCGKGMHWHSDMDNAVRLIISSSDAPATLHWRDGPGATRAQQVDIEYGSGTTFCLVYNVNSSLFGHKIQHCPESEQGRNVWVLSLIPKEDESLEVTPETIAKALEKLNESVDTPQ